MAIWVFVLITLWPAVGLAVLSLIDHLLQRRGKPSLPTANAGSEVLARMYLWPLVCWRIWKAVQQRRSL